MRWELGRRHRLGIALSGGGARGFAHIRVLRVLVEAGWRPAVVTGTSAGGIVGGLFAAGLSPEAIEALARRIHWRMFMRLDPDGTALVSTRGLARLLREAVGDVRIEELPIRFAAVAVDLDTGEEIWLDRGPLVEAMLATSAFPGVFPPVLWQGRRLIDGGVLNPLPVDVARGWGPPSSSEWISPDR
jgi:NTE family protein